MRTTGIGHAISVVAFIAALAGCQVAQQAAENAPAAATPALIEPLLATVGAPPNVLYGELRIIGACTIGGAYHLRAPEPGLIVRVRTPYPTNLEVELNGQALALSGTFADRERRIAAGEGFFFENPAYGTAPKFGDIDDREIALAFPRGAPAESELRIRDVSINPSHQGADRRSAPLTLRLTQVCPSVPVGQPGGTKDGGGARSTDMVAGIDCGCPVQGPYADVITPSRTATAYTFTPTPSGGVINLEIRARQARPNDPPVVPVISVGGSDVEGGFSPNERYFVYAYVSAPNTTHIQVVDLQQRDPNRYQNDIRFASAPGGAGDVRGVVAWGFSPDPYDRTFLYAYVSNANTVTWHAVNLQRRPATGPSSSIGAGSAFWKFSPCGDVVVVASRQSNTQMNAQFRRTLDGGALPGFSGDLNTVFSVSGGQHRSALPDGRNSRIMFANDAAEACRAP